MNTLYDQLKYNVDKINALYKNGVTFNKNTKWTAPLDGLVSLEGRGKSHYARDYELNSTYTAQGEMDNNKNFMWGYPDLVYALHDCRGSAARVMSAETNVKKGFSYDILFGSYQGSQDISFNDVTLNCSTYKYNRDIPKDYKISKIKNSLGNNIFNIGEVYRIENINELNCIGMGDCDVEITYYEEIEGWQKYVVRVSFKIINVLRQPSQYEKIPMYFTIKYSENVLNIFENEFM